MTLTKFNSKNKQQLLGTSKYMTNNNFAHDIWPQDHEAFLDLSQNANHS